MSDTAATPKPVLVELSRTGFAPSNADIAAHLRQQADWMEEADAAEVRNVLVVIEYMNGKTMIQSCGHPIDFAREVGLLTIAMVRDIIEPVR